MVPYSCFTLVQQNNYQREFWAWVFDKGGRLALIISTPETLAVQVSQRAYYGEEPSKTPFQGLGRAHLD